MNTLSKITPPRARSLVARPRLFKALDEGITWVTGPPGGGKTCLALSLLNLEKPRHLWYQLDAGDGDPATLFTYLTLALQRSQRRRTPPLPVFAPEHQLPIFARRFFEALFGQLPSGSLLVFDDYHTLPEASATHTVLREAFQALPAGIRVLVLSRQAPPAAFARLQAHGRMRNLDWKELEWTRSEAEQLIRLRVPRGTDRALADELIRQVGGWPAGLALLTHGRHGGAALPDPLAPGDRGLIFDYFASEVMEAMEPEHRELLLKAALLPRCTGPQAEALTGSAEAGSVLKNLARSGTFTAVLGQRNPSYVFHPLFRDFLLQQGRRWIPAAEHAALQRKGGMLLLEAGETEEAVRLFRACMDWDALADAIQRQAPELAWQGRLETLKEWIGWMPVSGTDAHPWLRFWLGVCELASDLQLSHGHFQAAFQRFGDMGDLAGQFMAWCGCTDTILYAWDDFHPLDHWIAWLEAHRIEFAAFAGSPIEASVTTSMVGALVQRQPGHPELGAWIKAALAVLHGGGDPRLRSQAGAYAAAYGFWTGSYALVSTIAREQERLAQAPGATDFCVLNWHFTRLCRFGSYQEASPRDHAAAVEQALAYSDRTGVHLLDFTIHAQEVIVAGLAGRIPEARRTLDAMGALRLGRNSRSLHHYLLAWIARLVGELPMALMHMERALELSEESGMPFSIALVRHGHAELLFDAGRRTEARETLAGALELGARLNSDYFPFICRLAEARFAQEEGQDPSEPLRAAMELGRRRGFLNVYWWVPGPMSRLFGQALSMGLEPEYARRVIRIRKLRPEHPEHTLEDWPWELRIHTLGSFRILREGRPLEPRSKTPRKVLMLLQAIIAAGRRGVSQATLADWLWPESDGDSAQQSLATCLHRLRQLLDVEGAVILKGGRLSLDPERCWVDAHAFEALLEQGPDGDSDPNAGKARALYEGPFLEGCDEAWALACRERLEALRQRLPRER